MTAERVEQPTAAVPQAGEAWHLTATVQVADFGPVPPGQVAFRLADGRPYLFPVTAGMWRPGHVPHAEDVLGARIHTWSRTAANAPRDSQEQAVAQAVVDELSAIRAEITEGTIG